MVTHDGKEKKVQKRKERIGRERKVKAKKGRKGECRKGGIGGYHLPEQDPPSSSS